MAELLATESATSSDAFPVVVDGDVATAVLSAPVVAGGALTDGPLRLRTGGPNSNGVAMTTMAVRASARRNRLSIAIRARSRDRVVATGVKRMTARNSANS